MKYRIFNYRISGFDLKLGIPDFMTLIPSDPFCLFRQPCSTEKIFEQELAERGFYFCPGGDSLLVPDEGRLFYSDQWNRVYKIHHGQNAGSMLRYIGFFDRPDILEGWRSCIVWKPGKAQCGSIYLKGGYEAGQLQKDIKDSDLFNALGMEYLLAHQNRTVLHSSFIIYNGTGIVFSAPSGTGKSTQAGLWQQYEPGTEIINGDRSILSCDMGVPRVHGIPFCGSSGISQNRTAPLRAVVILRQGKENRIQKLGRAQSVRLLLSECSVNIWDQEGTEKILDLLSALSLKVPVWLYHCLPDVSAVKFLKKYLDGEIK